MIRKILNNDSFRMATFLVTLIGAMWTLTTRLEDRMSARFDMVDARFDKIETRLDRIDSRLNSFGERIAKNEARLEASK